VEQEQYDALLAMFTSEGWQVFQQFTQERMQGINNSAYYWENEDQWKHAKGMHTILSEVLGFENFIRQSLEMQELEEEDVSLS
jgi:hypothetical protein